MRIASPQQNTANMFSSSFGFLSAVQSVESWNMAHGFFQEMSLLRIPTLTQAIPGQRLREVPCQKSVLWHWWFLKRVNCRTAHVSGSVVWSVSQAQVVASFCSCVGRGMLRHDFFETFQNHPRKQSRRKSEKIHQNLSASTAWSSSSLRPGTSWTSDWTDLFNNLNDGKHWQHLSKSITKQNYTCLW